MEGPVVQVLQTLSRKANMAENITIAERDKVSPELFDKIMKENFTLVSHLFLFFISVKQFWNKPVPYINTERKILGSLWEEFP